MRLPVSIYYLVLLILFVSEPVLAAAESISQIRSLQAQVWVQRGNEQIQVNSESEIYFGDTISTSDTGQLGIQLWSQVKLKLDANTKITIIPGSTNKPGTTKVESAAIMQKIIKLEHGTSCIEIEHLLDTPVLFQISDRITVNFKKPVELCLSNDADKSHIRLVKGSVELLQLANAMLIALNQPESEISFFDDGTYKLKSPSSEIEQVKLSQPAKGLYKVYLYSSHSYSGAEEVKKRFIDAGHDSVVVDEADDKGALYRVAVTGFGSLSAARAFIDNVALNLGVNDAWIARELAEK